MAKRKLSVFLSYAAGDVAAAQTLYGQLAAEGWLDVWFSDERLSPGADTHLEIEKAISTADLAIICISKNATTQSGLFQKQLRLILDAAQNMPEGVIYMIPLKLEECEPPFLLRHLQFANYFEGNREKVYASVLRSLQTRAKTLKITTATKSVTGTSASPEQSSAAIGVEGNVSNSAIVSGDHNVINIYNHKPESKDEE